MGDEPKNQNEENEGIAVAELDLTQEKGTSGKLPMPTLRPHETEELDLTKETEKTEGLITPKKAPYDPNPKREKIRGWIALVLLLLLSTVIIGSFYGLFYLEAALDDIKSLLELVLGSLIGLVGAVTGFYYGEKSKN